MSDFKKIEHFFLFINIKKEKKTYLPVIQIYSCNNIFIC